MCAHGQTERFVKIRSGVDRQNADGTSKFCRSANKQPRDPAAVSQANGPNDLNCFISSMILHFAHAVVISEQKRGAQPKPCLANWQKPPKPALRNAMSNSRNFSPKSLAPASPHRPPGGCKAPPDWSSTAKFVARPQWGHMRVPGFFVLVAVHFGDGRHGDHVCEMARLRAG